MVRMFAHGGVWRCIDWYFNGFPKPGELIKKIGHDDIIEYDYDKKAINKSKEQVL